MRAPIPRLPEDPHAPFPDPERSYHPDGLIAWGGDLSEARLLNAYRGGIFPWFEASGPILWWSPDPRAILIPGAVHVTRRLARTIRQGRFEITLDRAFDDVIRACARPRRGEAGTWITGNMIAAYQSLHRAGRAHSLEVWIDGELAGGVYGMALGKVFYAESKFHRRRDASKIALVKLMEYLEHWEFLLCDCQLWNPHLERMGVRMIDRHDFRRLLGVGIERPDQVGSWSERAAGG